jgi:hypothetical protein
LAEVDRVSRWTIFGGEAAALVRKITELLQEQARQLETANLLSKSDLERYESRSEQISELIRLLTEE